MSKVKAGGSSKNNHNNAGRRLGVKLSGGQTATAGAIIVRQPGASKVAGQGAYMSKDFTIHAAVAGTVSFRSVKKRSFTGRTHPRTEVCVG